MLERTERNGEIILKELSVEEKARRLSFGERIIVKVLSPFVYCWFGTCWCIMKLGRGIYWFGNMLSGFRIDPYNWTQEV